MGYHVRLIESDFTVPAEQVDRAFTAVKALNKVDSWKRGGHYSKGVQVETWFSWMAPDYDRITTSLQEVMEMVGFTVDTADDGSVSLVGYDRKTGQEELFLSILALAVPEGSYMLWEGEEGERFRHVVEEGNLRFQEPVNSPPQSLTMPPMTAEEGLALRAAISKEVSQGISAAHAVIMN